MPVTHFTADTHFGHASIIRFSKRPFADVNEMDERLIKNWNEVVKPNDDVYHLGDFNFRSTLSTGYYISRLNGRIHLIEGNHDDQYALKEWKAFQKARLTVKLALGGRPMFESVQAVKYLKLYGESITLYHYAQRVWRNSHHGAWHLFGHSHNSLPSYHRSMDVGVDAQHYTPISFEQVREWMKDKDVTLHHPELVTDPWEKDPVLHDMMGTAEAES